jgi:hypothetical protein
MTTERLRLCLEGGNSVIIGTVDADGIPSCCRGIAVSTKDNFETVTVYVPVATAQETLANVATTRRIAVVMTEVLSHTSLQIKGVARGVRLAPASDEAFVRQRLHQFADTLDTIGQPRRITNRMTCWPAFAIDLTVEQVFDQTPGPKAGNCLT